MKLAFHECRRLRHASVIAGTVLPSLRVPCMNIGQCCWMRNVYLNTSNSSCIWKLRLQTCWQLTDHRDPLALLQVISMAKFGGNRIFEIFHAENDLGPNPTQFPSTGAAVPMGNSAVGWGQSWRSPPGTGFLFRRASFSCPGT